MTRKRTYVPPDPPSARMIHHRIAVAHHLAEYRVVLRELAEDAKWAEANTGLLRTMVGMVEQAKTFYEACEAYALCRIHVSQAEHPKHHEAVREKLNTALSNAHEFAMAFATSNHHWIDKRHSGAVARRLHRMVNDVESAFQQAYEDVRPDG